jgi:Ca2+-binding RTX toxin-like protein
LDGTEGSRRDDTISGASGNDTISGGAGNDSVVGDSGDDLLLGDLQDGVDEGVDASPLVLYINNLTHVSHDPIDDDEGGASVGDYAEYNNVATLTDGTVVSARVVLTELSDPDVQISLASHEGAEIWFASGQNGESASFRLEFYNQDTGEPVALNATTTFNDIDADSGSEVESITLDAGSFVAYATSSDTSVSITTTSDSVTATGTETNSPDDQDAWFSAQFEDRSYIEFSLGARDSSSGFTLSGDLIDGGVFIPIEQGADTLVGGTGSDTIYGEGGHDVLDGGDDNDEIWGGDGADSVMGGDGNDTLEGNDGSDTLSGGDGSDLIYGGAGDDLLSTGLGQDTLYGGDGNDTLRNSAGDDSMVGGTGNDSLVASAGNDTLEGGEGNDTLIGGADNDSALGDSGDDTIYGDQGPLQRIAFEWDAIPDPDDGGQIDDLDPITTGSQVINSVTVDYTVTNNAGKFENTTVYTVGIDSGSSTVNTNSALGFEDFDGALTLDFDQEVENVAFRINDFEQNSETIYIRAFDESGTQIPITVTEGSGIQGSDTDTLAGNDSFEGPNSDTGDNSPDGSILVEIAGPVSLIEVVYTENNGSLTMTDVWFDDPETGDVSFPGGDDIIDGGEGSDFVDGGGGSDTINVDQGDTVLGGDGDDYFVLTDLDTTGTGNDSISITGGEGDETVGDTLVLTSDVAFSDITFTDGDPGTGMNGSFTMPDGTFVQFSEIENIICFTPRTRILTEVGERPIETPQVGDRVVTRDNGLQPIRWIGTRTVPATDRFAPVFISPCVALGSENGLLVSPQHRIMMTGYKAELLFGASEVLVPAKHLIDGLAVHRQKQETVTYIHIMFDRHEIIYAEGVATESFHAGDTALTALCEETREEVFAIFPELRTAPLKLGNTARPCLKRYESRLLGTENLCLQ